MTDNRCNGQQLVVPTVDNYVMVQEPPQAVIVINGAANLTRLVYEFEEGLRIFHDVHIFATSQPNVRSSEEEEEPYDDEEDLGDDLSMKASQHAQKVEQAKSERMSSFCFSLSKTLLREILL